jgi:dihydroorotase
MEGHRYRWHVVDTFVNGHLVYNDGLFDAGYIGEEIRFRQ